MTAEGVCNISFVRNCFVSITVFMLSISSFSQIDSSDEINYNNVSISTLIDSISIRFGYNFAYDADVVNSDSVVTVSFFSDEVTNWITNFFSSSDVNVSFINNQVVVGKRRGEFISDSFIELSGIVINASSKTPLSMVNIGVEGKPVGTITNDLGEFNFLLPLKYENETLVFSYLGYSSAKQLISQNQPFLNVQLHSTSVTLPEVKVLYQNPTDVVWQAKVNLAQNYLSQHSFLTAFFRETIQQDGSYVDVSEAIVEILKPPYNNPLDEERVRFIKGRKGRELDKKSLINFKLAGGPYHFSRLDIVRYGDFFPDDNGHSNYKYSFNGVSSEYDKTIYLIGFKPRNDSRELYYQGELRIEAETYAIIGAEFELTVQSIRRSRGYLIKRDARRFRTRPIYARYRVDYRPFNNVWMLSRVKGEVNLRISDRKQRERSVFNTVSEMLVTDLSVADSRQRIRLSDTFRPDYVLSEHLGDFDPNFWSNYNTIKPSEELEKVLRK